MAGVLHCQQHTSRLRPSTGLVCWLLLLHLGASHQCALHSNDRKVCLLGAAQRAGSSCSQAGWHQPGQGAAPGVQGLEKSTLPRNTRMVALGNRANFEFRAFQVCPLSCPCLVWRFRSLPGGGQPAEEPRCTHDGKSCRRAHSLPPLGGLS